MLLNFTYKNNNSNVRSGIGIRNGDTSKNYSLISALPERCSFEAIFFEVFSPAFSLTSFVLKNTIKRRVTNVKISFATGLRIYSLLTTNPLRLKLAETWDCTLILVSMCLLGMRTALGRTVSLRVQNIKLTLYTLIRCREGKLYLITK